MLFKTFTTLAAGCCLLLLQTNAQSSEQVSKLKDTIQHQPIGGLTKAQKLVATTGEDLLSGNNAHHGQTVLSGYGQASFHQDFKNKNATGSLDRAVFFVGHQFNNKFAFFSELEVANATLGEGKLNGEIGFEQLYLKMSLNPRQYFVAGLFLPRIGFLNENHLPTNYFGTDRTFVEQLIIPSTWRELGIGFYGQMSTAPITYSIALLNGLNASTFEHGTGFGGGKGEGQFVNFNGIAITGAVQAYVSDFRFQISAYTGGSLPYSKYQADSLGLSKGLFAAPIHLGEVDVQYNKNGVFAKALATYVALPDASELNTVFANNTPQSMYGTYVELGYNIFENSKSKLFEDKKLIAFARYEKLNVNNSIPQSGIIDPTLNQSHFLLGLNFLPIPNIVMKADIRFTHTGPMNKALFLNPPPLMMPYQQNNSFLNLGIGYSF